MDFCDNAVEQSTHGFHFLNTNNINLRNNHINNHNIGLEINTGDARIGPQKGHGNEWDLDPDACVILAASVSNGNPLNSEFVVPEGNILPWLPPIVKLFPDPNSIPWFYQDVAVPLDYCVPMLEPQPRQLSPYEKEVVVGTSGLAGVSLWDLKREVYTKLLIFPDLRPTGSPEATFFNNLNTSNLAYFGNVVQQIRYSLSFTLAYQQAYDAYTAASELAFMNLKVFDENMNYASTINLTDTWFAQRDTLLQQIIINVASELALEYARNQQLGTGLQNSLNYNSAINTTLTYELARKVINELRIRHLLGQPITQSLYQQALALAQQSPATVGAAANEAIDFLAPCDQSLFMDMEEGHNQSGERKGYGSQYIAEMQIAPNPTTGFMEVTLPNTSGGLLAVYNVNGQKVKSLYTERETSQVALDLSQSPTGLYWIVFSNEYGQVIGTAKISVLH